MGDKMKTKRERKAAAQPGGIDGDAVREARRVLSKLRRASTRSTSRSGKDWSAVAKEQRAEIRQLKKDLKAAQRGEARAIRVAQSFVDALKGSAMPNPTQATTV